jgi:hypothetical protein
MIAAPVSFDESTLAYLRQIDPVCQRYRAVFDCLEWSVVPERDAQRPWPGSAPHPQAAYIKALLVKLCEGKPCITQLRTFLIEHPLLVLELGFRPVRDTTQPYGFKVAQTVPCERWLREKQRTLPQALLQRLLAATVHRLQTLIPGLGETVAFDVKHIYAWVQANNPKAYVETRFDPQRQPTGDPHCRLGVKRSRNQDQPEGTTSERKEYVWGYGSGVAAATVKGYGDVVLAEYTQPFNEVDNTYFHPLYQQTLATLGRRPTHITADAAFDDWDIYQTCAETGGIAAIPLNLRGHPAPDRLSDGTPRCAAGLAMTPSYTFQHTHGYRAQRFRCPLLFPQPSGVTCDHEQFVKGPGCVKDPNIEPGGLMRVLLDRQSEAYKAIYRQRSTDERINSQATALGIERPRVRNQQSVANLNTLTYIVINVRALQRVRTFRTRSPAPSTLC